MQTVGHGVTGKARVPARLWDVCNGGCGEYEQGIVWVD